MMPHPADHALRQVRTLREVPRPPQDLAVLADEWIAEVSNEPDAGPVVEDLIMGEGLHLLVGEPGSLKTMLGLQAAACVANGLDLLGHATRRMPVVYVLYEGQRRWTAERMVAQRTGLRAAAAGFHLIWKPPVQLEDDETFADLLYSVERRAPCAVFLDPYAESHGLDEVKDAGALLARLRRVEQAAGGPVILLHHPNQDTKAARTHRIRGHGSLNGKSELSMWMDRPDPNGPLVNLSWIKVRDGDPPLPLTLRFDPESMLLIPTIERASLKVTARRIVEARGSLPRHALQSELRSRSSGKSDRACRKAVAELIEDGTLRAGDDGSMRFGTAWEVRQ